MKQRKHSFHFRRSTLSSQQSNYLNIHSLLLLLPSIQTHSTNQEHYDRFQVRTTKTITAWSHRSHHHREGLPTCTNTTFINKRNYTKWVPQPLQRIQTTILMLAKKPSMWRWEEDYFIKKLKSLCWVLGYCENDDLVIELGIKMLRLGKIWSFGLRRIYEALVLNR